MPGKAAKVLVSERQLEILTEFQRSQTEPRFVSKRGGHHCVGLERTIE